MAYPPTHHALKDHIAAVQGVCIYFTSASIPAAVPQECNGALPDSCPSPRLWGLNRIRAPTVWNALPGEVNSNPTASVMVIDSGIRATHNDLTSNLLPELTVTGLSNGNAILPVRQPLNVPPTPAEIPIVNHGTHVSGTVFARWNNAGGAAGVVGRARGGSCGCGVTERSLDGACLTNCINYAAEQGVRVINLSWERIQPPILPGEPSFERDAIVRFCNTGGIITIAAGNGEVVQGVRTGRNIVRPGSSVYPAAWASDLTGGCASVCACLLDHLVSGAMCSHCA
jgi:subtilisin family serine protease